MKNNKKKKCSRNKISDETWVCCDCGSDRVEFCTIGWFDSKTNQFIQIADLGCEYRRELYCRNCQDSVEDFIRKYEFDSLEPNTKENKCKVVDKNCLIQYYSRHCRKKEHVKHNDCGEMICCYCNEINLEYSVYAWFDLNTEEFIEFAEDPQNLSYTSIWCNDCDELYPEGVSQEYLLQ